MKHYLLAVALMTATSHVYAAPACMHYDPNHPAAHHAPAWAVVIQNRRDRLPHSVRPEGAMDPLWQHAICDAAHRTIVWCFPGGDTGEPQCETVK